MHHQLGAKTQRAAAVHRLHGASISQVQNFRALGCRVMYRVLLNSNMAINMMYIRIIS